MSTAPPIRSGSKTSAAISNTWPPSVLVRGKLPAVHGIRFLYLQVLDWPGFDVDIPIPKKAQRIPELLTRAEVRRILTACANPSIG